MDEKRRAVRVGRLNTAKSRQCGNNHVFRLAGKTYIVKTTERFDLIANAIGAVLVTGAMVIITILYFVIFGG